MSLTWPGAAQRHAVDRGLEWICPPHFQWRIHGGIDSAVPFLSFPTELDLPLPFDVQMLKSFQLQVGFAPYLPTSGSALGPGWGLHLQIPL